MKSQFIRSKNPFSNRNKIFSTWKCLLHEFPFLVCLCWFKNAKTTIILNKTKQNKTVLSVLYILCIGLWPINFYTLFTIRDSCVQFLSQFIFCLYKVIVHVSSFECGAARLFHKWFWWHKNKVQRLSCLYKNGWMYLEPTSTIIIYYGYISEHFISESCLDLVAISARSYALQTIKFPSAAFLSRLDLWFIGVGLSTNHVYCWVCMTGGHPNDSSLCDNGRTDGRRVSGNIASNLLLN